MEPALRRATRADLPLLARLIQAYYRFEGIPFALYRVEGALIPLLDSDESGHVWLIESLGKTVGYTVFCHGYSLEQGGRTGIIDELFLVEGARRRGLGRGVVQQLLAMARQQALVAVSLEVLGDNDAAVKFYEAAGFRAEARSCMAIPTGAVVGR